jgi:hypothetical protein
LGTDVLDTWIPLARTWDEAALPTWSGNLQTADLYFQAPAGLDLAVDEVTFAVAPPAP